MENNSKDKGFTLVELLIVIVILGILATITVFAVRGITDKGHTSACKADNKTLVVATESYFAQYGGTAIPTTVAGSVPAGATWALGADAEATLVNAGLLNSVSSKWTLAADGAMAPVAPCTAAMLTAP